MPSLDSVRRLFDVAHPRQVGLVSTAHGANEFYSIVLPPILPLLVSGFEIGYTRAGLLVTTYFVMYTVFQLPAGFVADRVGQRKLIAWGLVVLSLGMLASSAAPTYLALLGAQALAGVGGSTYHPAGMSLISDIQSTDTEGRAMGLHGVAGIGGRLVAPVLVGGLATAYDWRVALAASAVFGVVIAVSFARYVEVPAAAGSADDDDGDGDTDGPTTASLRERARAAAADAVRVPLADWVVLLVLAKVLFTLQSGAVKTFTTSYVFARVGGSSSFANGVFFALIVGSAVSTLWLGALADRFDRARLVTATFLLAGVLLLTTALVPATGAVYYVWFFLVGAAVYANLPVINSLTSQYAETEFSGSLFGVIQTASALGNTVSPVLFGAVATRFGIATAVPAAGVVGVVAGLAFLLAGRRAF
ncbi:MAG: MFS transporter [Haloferacaceae archaeon]